MCAGEDAYVMQRCSGRRLRVLSCLKHVVGLFSVQFFVCLVPMAGFGLLTVFTHDVGSHGGLACVTR